MLHVYLSRVRSRCLGGGRPWEELSVFSQVEVSGGSREDGVFLGAWRSTVEKWELAKHSCKEISYNPH